MKAIRFLLFLSLFIPAQLHAQKIDPKAVPKPVQDVFIKDFPGIMAEWELTNGHIVASFEQNKYKMQTVYNASGRRLETRVAIEEKELPESARDYVKTHNSAGITSASKIIGEGDKVNFRVLAGAQYLDFDAKGNYLHTADK